MIQRRKGAAVWLACAVLAGILFLAAVPAKAASKTVSTLAELQQAVADAGKGDVIRISGTIAVKDGISIAYNKQFTLKGGTLKRAPGYTGTMISIKGKPDKYIQGPSEAKITFDGLILDGNKKRVSDTGSLMYFYSGATVKIKNCILRNNAGSGISAGSDWGSGMAFVPTTITGSQIINNGDDGIDYYGSTNGSDGEMTITDTVISGNGDDGISSNNGFTLNNVVIKKNGGDGIYCGCGLEHFKIRGGDICGNGGYGVNIRSCHVTLTGGAKVRANKKSGLYDGNSSIDRESSVTLGKVEISGNREYGLAIYDRIILTGAAKIADPVQLKYSIYADDHGVILVDSKLSYKGLIAKVDIDGIANGSSCIYIGKASYAKLTQFKCLYEGHKFRMGGDGWATLEMGEDESMPDTPVLKAVKKGSTSAKLSWKRLSDVDGYEIRVSVNGGKYKKLVTAAPSSAKYTAKGLKAGGTYKYKMRAFRKVNGKTVYGGYSEVQTVKM